MTTDGIEKCISVSPFRLLSASTEEKVASAKRYLGHGRRGVFRNSPQGTRLVCGWSVAFASTTSAKINGSMASESHAALRT